VFFDVGIQDETTVSDDYNVNLRPVKYTGKFLRMIYSLLFSTVAFAFLYKSRKPNSLLLWAIPAVLVGFVIPFGSILSWIFLYKAAYRDDYPRKPSSFDKAFGDDWKE